MDSLDALLKASGLLLPLLWKEGLARRAHRRSGKRIQYVAWHDGHSGLLNPRLRKLRMHFPDEGRLAENLDRPRANIAQIFLWNSGTEDLSSSDFFPDNPVFLDLIGGEIVGHRILYQTDDLLRSGTSQIQRPQENPVQLGSSQVVGMQFAHWPPGAGLVVELRYRTRSPRVPKLRVGGPIRGLKERSYIGTLWRIDLNKAPELSAQLAATHCILWVSGIGFVIAVAALASHIHVWPTTEAAYWVALLTAVAFEWILVVWNEKRVQLTKKVCRSLAYWLDIKQTT